MSVIKKKPYIEAKLELLDSTVVTALQTAINSSNPTTLLAGFGNMPANTKVADCHFELEEGNVKQGFLINDSTAGVCMLLGYARFPEITIYELNTTTYKYKKIWEHLDINELRRVIGDILGEGGEGEELTPTALAEVLEGSESVSIDLNEAGTKLQAKIDQDILDFILPKELALADFQHEVGDTNTVIVINPSVVDADNAYDVSLEIEGTGVHYGVGFVVFPYNGSQCVTTSLMTINGETKECYATMDESGQINLTIPYVMTPQSEDTSIYIKRRI